MYLHKIRHPHNFVFAHDVAPDGGFHLNGRDFRSEVTALGGDVFRWRVTGPACWEKNHSQAVLTPPDLPTGQAALDFSATGTLSLTEAGQPLLASGVGRGFGVAGEGWIFTFLHQPTMQFYGMGEKNNGFEKTGKRTKFWNVDVWGDFGYLPQVENGVTDPMYANVPYLLIKQGNRYLGILVNNPQAVFMDTHSNYHFAGRPKDHVPTCWIGCDRGQPELYFIHGPTLADVTRKLQQLCGPTPRPPLWALGHHQCRWGYKGTQDLRQLDQQFDEHAIPCDGLWLDIDYMDDFKVFTFNPRHFDDVREDLAPLIAKGRKVVPILDPGVKRCTDYPVYEQGRERGVFCLNLERQEFVGHVWPGETVFPDYSLPETRAWWAEWVADFARQGIAGAWIDMNDPSLSGTEPFDMLFNHGTEPHDTYHNQYALGMAQATREGFLQAAPDLRPFVLSRSGFISQSRYAALWTGDNCSNFHHLAQSIPMTLNLALSGIPFCAPDVPGFALNATPELAVKWYQAGFLFPFLRNHSIQKSQPKEPWAFGPSALESIRHYIRLRYKLLPYLYNLFIAQEATGEAILRPLFYDFADSESLPLGLVDDQFLVGPSLMQAPIVVAGATQRSVCLPGEARWLAAHEGRWLAGGQRVETQAEGLATPLYFREGALVPMQCGERTHARNDLHDIELHVFLSCKSSGTYRYRYTCDAGEGFTYCSGEETQIDFAVQCQDGALTVEAACEHDGAGPVQVSLVLYDTFREIVCHHGSSHRVLATWAASMNLAGCGLPVQITEPFTPAHP